MSGAVINVSAAAPDFGARAADYRRHRRGFPAAFFGRLSALGLLGAGARVVDLGTGTGTLALGLAGRGAKVIGVDISAKMLAAAAKNARAAGACVDWVEARAEDTGLEAGVFDLVCAGQCWHWLERGAAAAEALRLLRPTGALVVAHLDWIEVPGAVLEATLAVVRRFGRFPERACVGTRATYPIWLDELAGSGFEVESFSFDVDLDYDHTALCGRMRASAALCALDAETLGRFDSAYAREVASRFVEPFAVPHRVYAVIARPRA